MFISSESHRSDSIQKNYPKLESPKTYKVSGGRSEGETPVPISNTAVKPLSADGTAWETVWESRSPPGLIFEKPLDLQGLFPFQANC